MNGFDRIGRPPRAIIERPESGSELVSIRDLAELDTGAWLFSNRVVGVATTIAGEG